MSELAGGAIGRATLYAKGATEDQAMAFLQPIVIDSHVLNNPWLNYSVYLSNTIIPGILMLLIFMTTVYTIGSEMKTNTQKRMDGHGRQFHHRSPDRQIAAPDCSFSLSWPPSIMFIYTVSCTIPVIAVYCPCCLPVCY